MPLQLPSKVAGGAWLPRWGVAFTLRSLRAGTWLRHGRSPGQVIGIQAGKLYRRTLPVGWDSFPDLPALLLTPTTTSSLVFLA